MSKYIYSMTLFTLCYLLTACVAEELQGPVAGSGEGYLVLQLGSVSAEVQSAPLTKATTTLTELGVPLPSVDQFTITIKDSNGSTVKKDTYGELKQSSSVVLPKGTYTVEASQGDNLALQDKPYFYDSIDITIESLKSTNCPLKPSLGNAMLVPVVDETLKKHYTSWSLKVSVGTDSDTYSKTLASSTETNKLYVKQDSAVTVTFSGTNLINGQTSKTATITNHAQPRTQYVIQCNPENLPSFTLETSATAQHTKDSEENLNGTQVVLRVDTLTGTPTALITGWQAKLCKSDGTVVRTLSLSDVPSSENEYVMNTEGNWPYLPQGEYTLRSQLSLKTGELTTENVSTVKVLAPTFTVTASAYTSYNKYLNGDIDGANACDGSTIYEMKAVPTISAELLSNSNYSKSSTLTLDGTPIAEGDATSQSWVAHTLVTSYTFDEVSQNGNETYHVTGIPYYKSFYNKDLADWDSDNVELYLDNKNHFSFKPDKAWILSPQFYVPKDAISANVIMSVYAYHSSPARSYTPTLYVSASDKAQQSGEQETFNGSSLSPSFTPITKHISLSTELDHISIYVYGTTKGLDIGRFMMENCIVLYK